MRKYPTKKLIEETKAIIRLSRFLRHECGLEYADEFSTIEPRAVLSILSKSAK